MCGIVGYYGMTTAGFDSDRRKFILNALLMDQVRGEDSTGIALLPKAVGIEPAIYKKAMCGADFIGLPKTNKLLNRLTDSSGVIGHNRSATWKDISDHTAHPFLHKYITLVHNGHINNYNEIAPKCKVMVDSAHIAHAFGEGEPDDILKELRGDFSLVWHDSRDNSLHFARNGGRPMYWMFDPYKNVMYYGSEYSILWACAKRNNITLNPTVWETEAMTHYTFPSASKVGEFTKKAFLPPVVIHQRRDWERTLPSSDTATGDSKTPISLIGNSSNAVSILHDPKAINEETDSTKLAQLATAHGLRTKDLVYVEPVARVAYSDAAGKEQAKGYIKCRHNMSGCTIELHGTVLADWMIASQKKVIPILLTGFRRGMKINDKPVFVGMYVKDVHAYKNTSNLLTKKEAEEQTNEMVHLPNTNVYVSRDKFREMVAGGCVSCGDSIALVDSKGVKWVGVDRNMPVCPDCTKDEQAMKLVKEIYVTYD